MSFIKAYSTIVEILELSQKIDANALYDILEYCLLREYLCQVYQECYDFQQ